MLLTHSEDLSASIHLNSSYSSANEFSHAGEMIFVNQFLAMGTSLLHERPLFTIWMCWPVPFLMLIEASAIELFLAVRTHAPQL